MHILIDCGFTDGRAVKDILSGKDGDWIVYGFEPNKDFYGKTLDSQFRTVFIPAAVWTSNCIKTYFRCNDESENEYEKNNIVDINDGESSELVVCLDLSDWMDKAISPEDHVILKLDIEGSEFEVLEHLLNTGKLSLVKELMVEWHERFFEAIQDKIECRIHIEERIAKEYPELIIRDWY